MSFCIQTHDEIVFGSLFQREVWRPSLSFTAVEKVLPKAMRKEIKSGWRAQTNGGWPPK